MCLVGCTVDFWTDALSTNHKSAYDAMFLDRVGLNIKAELSGQQPYSAASWQEYWILLCKQIQASPGMGAPYIQYIINHRRAVGLPDIPEIEKMAITDEKSKQMPNTH